jgi:hypothetical protein
MEQFLNQFDGFFLCLLFLAPLLLLQRGLHREIQSIFLLITRRVDISYVMFSLLFLPGVFLHETSHFVMARLVGVRTGKFSLLPKPLGDGRLQLGYVETASTDLFRDALIGSAPLLTGGAFVIYAGIYHLNLEVLWNGLQSGAFSEMMAALSNIMSGADFWVWFYLTFTVSSTMLPSASDRRTWRPLAFIGILIAGLILLAGLGGWFLNNLVPYLNQAMQTAAVVLGISTAIHFVLYPPSWAIRKVLSRILGLKVL